jgi:hypothetical protein
MPGLQGQLEPHLATEELAAARERLAELLSARRFPQPHPDWPAIPWPWY